MTFRSQQSWKYVGNTTKPGDPKWDEFVEVDDKGKETGRRSLQIHTPKLIADFNCDHFYKPIDGSNVQCTKCGHGQQIVWGLQIIKDGKIIEVRPQ